jgi:hypothetical protein
MLEATERKENPHSRESKTMEGCEDEERETAGLPSMEAYIPGNGVGNDDRGFALVPIGTLKCWHHLRSDGPDKVRHHYNTTHAKPPSGMC